MKRVIVLLFFGFVTGIILFLLLLICGVYYFRSAPLAGSEELVFSTSSSSEIFGGDEYECFGTCYCHDGEGDERRSSVTGSGVRTMSIFVVGLTSLLAMKQAKNDLSERCLENFSKNCDIESIRSEIDECVIGTEKLGESECDKCESARCRMSYSYLSKEEKHRVLDGDVSVDGLIKKIGIYRNVIVLTGAGISVNAGIPDYRSETGIYENPEEYGIENPEEAFNIHSFKKNPIPFYKIAKKVFFSEGGHRKYEPTKSHHFIKLLYDQGILLRVYTQNVDGLEIQAGIPSHKVVEAHGNFRSCRCIKCGEEYDIKKFMKLVDEDEYPIFCPHCGDGLVKPNVVFFGEPLPQNFLAHQQDDFEKCDLLIVMGTSLKVPPFCKLVEHVKPTVPRLLINENEVGPWRGNWLLTGKYGENYRDVKMLGDCDEKSQEFAQKCGWEIDC